MECGGENDKGDGIRREDQCNGAGFFMESKREVIIEVMVQMVEKMMAEGAEEEVEDKPGEYGELLRR